MQFLNEGHKPPQLTAMLPYLRHEKKGIHRIGQTGVKAAKETRLYIFILEAAKTIFIISMGHKETQQDDINDAVELSASITKSLET